MRRESPHKDVVHLWVSVGSNVTAEEYQCIADRELEEVLHAWEGKDLPLYEVRMEFHAPRPEGGEEKTAAFTWRATANARVSMARPGNRSLVLY